MLLFDVQQDTHFDIRNPFTREQGPDSIYINMLLSIVALFG